MRERYRKLAVEISKYQKDKVQYKFNNLVEKLDRR